MWTTFNVFIKFVKYYSVLYVSGFLVTSLKGSYLPEQGLNWCPQHRKAKS